MRNDWLRSGKSPYFTLSFSFHINISVKVGEGCYETCAETRKSSSAINRVVQMKDEVEFRRNFRIYRAAAGHFPDTAARVSRQ